MPRKPNTEGDPAARKPRVRKPAAARRGDPLEARSKQITGHGSVEAVYSFGVADTPRDPDNPNSKVDLALQSYVPPVGTSRQTANRNRNRASLFGEGASIRGELTEMPKGTVKPGAATLRAVMARLESVSEKIETAIDTAAVTGLAALIEETMADVRSGLNGSVEDSDLSLIFPSGEEGDAQLKGAVVRAMFRAANTAAEPYRATRQRKAKDGEGDTSADTDSDQE